MVGNLRSFLFERAVDMSEGELNALLALHLEGDGAMDGSASTASAELEGAVESLGELAVEVDDCLREPEGARSSLEDALVPELPQQEEEADYEAGRYSPLPPVTQPHSQQPSFLV